MKAMTINTLVLVALMGALAIPSLANTPPSVKHDNNRLRNQSARIRNGIKTGQLTRHEANLLRQREARIRLTEAHDRLTGGRVTPAERRRLNGKINHASWAIFHQKHDAQHR